MKKEYDFSKGERGKFYNKDATFELPIYLASKKANFSPKICYNHSQIKAQEATMQTLTINVKDDFMNEFIKFIETAKDHITIEKDPNLEYDPYFYERQKKLQKIRDDIKSGKAKTTDFEDFKADMDDLEKELEEKYAN